MTGAELTVDAAVAQPPLAAGGANDLVSSALARVLERGHSVPAERSYAEILNQHLVLLDPRERITTLEASSFSHRVAIARLVWHLAASSSLEAIALYEPRAAGFSDDGLTVPGSNFGARLFGDGSGIDQMRGIVERLRGDPATRRAAAVVWRPDDAVRLSRDIPCALTMVCHVREGQLVTTLTMRSNNAVRLLPYNLFEFSFMAEMIATEVGVPLGPYVHSVCSLHIYDDERSQAWEMTASAPRGEALAAMGEMPSCPAPLEQAGTLVELERACRRRSGTRDDARIDELLGRLHPYWRALARGLRPGGVDV